MVAAVNMKLIGRVQLPTIAIVFLAIVVKSGAQERCSSPMSVPGSKTNTIIIQNVSELSPPNTVLKKLIFAGSDTEISLRMTTVNDNIRFNDSTRELIVNKSFNITDGNPNNVYVSIACTAASPGITTTFQIVIQVYDMNNNAPWFANLPYSVNISERTSVNSSVFDGVQAIDADPSDRGYLIYSVADNAIFSSYFSFPVSSVGNLVLMKTLDYERIQSFNLTVTVMDNGNNLTVLGRLQPQHTVTTSILVTILPADDYNPVFNQSTYTGVLDIELNRSAVSLDTAIGASIKYARPDERFIFSIVQDDNNADASYFVIENRTGLIRTTTSLLSQISSDLVAFQIQATKVGQSYRYGRALVKLNVRRSTKPLRFTQPTYSASVVVSAPLGTLVATVIAIEGSSSPVYYFNADIKEFTIDSKTGEIRTTTTISYNASKLYNFTVTANDSTTTDVCRVILAVVQQNRRNPHFAQTVYTFVISKDTSFVGQITGTDEDPNSVLNYQLIDPSSYFTVDNNGRLFCNCSSAGYFSSSTPGNTHSMVLIAENDGDPVPLQTSALVVLTWNSTGPPVRPIPVCDGMSDATFNAYYIAVVVLGVTAGLFLIIAFILILCLCRRNGMQSDPRPRVTIEVDGTPQKSQNYSGFQGNSKPGNGFEVAAEYSPYFAYGGGVEAADVSAQTSSTLSSSEILQKLRAYRGVPTPSSVEKPSDPSDDNDTDSRSTSDLKQHHHHQQQHRSTPYSSTSVGTFASSSSSPPSSRVDRYQFEDDEAAAAAAIGRQVQYPKSRSTRASSLGTVPESRCLGGGGVPPGGRLRGRGLQPGTASADGGGDTSSTETLVTRAGKQPRAKQSNVSFVDNVGGYLSSQEFDASSSALQRSDEDPAITVYY